MSVLLNGYLIDHIETKLRVSLALALVSDLLFALTLFAIFFAPLVLFGFLLQLPEIHMLSQPSLFLSLNKLLISEFHLFSNESLLFFFLGDFVFAPLFLLLFLREYILSLFK